MKGTFTTTTPMKQISGYGVLYELEGRVQDFQEQEARPDNNSRINQRAACVDHRMSKYSSGETHR